MEIATPSGPARVALDDLDDPAFLLVMTHGSNDGVDVPDLLAVRAVALELGGAVARVLQPFRVAGLRTPGSAAKQDHAWLMVVAALRGVLALAFPLHPPWNPETSRANELKQAGVEVVVVNGDRDPFGVPDPAAATRAHVLPGERHDLGKDPSRVAEAVVGWLRRWSIEPG